MIIGNETYDIYFKNMKTGDIIDTISGCGGTVIWGNDDSTIFYNKLDSELRQFQVWLHNVGMYNNILLLNIFSFSFFLFQD